MTITTIGLDLAKRVFQLSWGHEAGATVLTKRLHRKQMLPFFSKLSRCLIGMEACGTAHYWGPHARCHGTRGPPHSALLREGLCKARQERCVRRRGDLGEAVQRPTMRFVPVKTVEQQSILMAHRARSLFVRQRTMLDQCFARASGGARSRRQSRDRQSDDAGSASAF